MDKIGDGTIWSFLDGKNEADKASNQEIRRGNGHKVDSYLDLAKKVAELQFRNRSHVLLFRGQPEDYKTKKTGGSLLKPRIFRLVGKKLPTKASLTKRFEKLAVAEEILVRRYKDECLLGAERLERYPILRWAILQHYEVCETPLLDVTSSLRIATNFAASDPANTQDAFVYAIAVPNISGAITASSEAGLQVVRLSSACPPTAVRPHLQEGYLLGEYPEIGSYKQNAHYRYHEFDFGRRLVAKFRFNPNRFWRDPRFQPLPKEGLFPSKAVDPFSVIIEKANEALRSLET